MAITRMKTILTTSTVRRQLLHTITSRTTIKPSSPTPSHLRTYNFSKLDLLNPRAHLPFILFYPNNPNSPLTPSDKSTILKNSLSLSLTNHYPFAGRLPTPIAPSYVDCNDEGVVFAEAVNDEKMESFRLMTGQDEGLGQLFADGVVHSKPPGGTDLVRVQVNQFCCGGVGVAVSMSHLIGDTCSLASFLAHWASVARYGSVDHQQVLPLNPHVILYPRTDSIQPESQSPAPAPAPANTTSTQPRFVARRFVFPNSKLSKLKNKVSSDGSVNNPTRVEVLSSLIYKTAVAAATTETSVFKPSSLFFMVNMRSKFVQKLPETTMGNFVSLLVVPTRRADETSLHRMVAEIKKQKLQFDGIESVEKLAEKSELVQARNQDAENVAYFGSSFCNFPFSKVDFGWGKPIGTTLATKTSSKNGFVLMDTLDGDGIEALVMLEEHHMKSFENDKEMLSFCRTN